MNIFQINYGREELYKLIDNVIHGMYLHSINHNFDKKNTISLKLLKECIQLVEKQ